jgi:hypothetical protein
MCLAMRFMSYLQATQLINLRRLDHWEYTFSAKPKTAKTTINQLIKKAIFQVNLHFY